MSKPVHISVVITVKNEARNMEDLLDSLVVQEQPFDVWIIDAASTDGTQDIVRRYQKKYPFIHLEQYAAQRGESRNRGIERCKGDAVAFIDGDCIANPFWLHEMRAGLKNEDIVAGKTINLGYQPFVDLDRVELFYKDVDVTFPSCNLLYRKKVFDRIDGFDPRFITAEDIDLNVRAVDAGFGIFYNPRVIVYHRARSTFVAFFKQAFWNGYGRKQLTRKHGSMWGKYNPGDMLRHKMTEWYFIRLVVAMLGYFSAKINRE